MMHKRLALVAVLLLTACQQQQEPPQTLPPQEVLQNAAQATRKLQSAQYLITADYDIDSGATWQAQGVLRIDGTLQESGRQMRFQTDLTAQVQDSVTGDYTLEGLLEVVVLEGENVYLNIQSLKSQPDNMLYDPKLIAQLVDVWWMLPENEMPPESVSLTPDPKLLQAQAEVISIKDEHGIEEVNGIPSYHYSVELDKNKLLSYMESLGSERGEDFSEVDLALSSATTKGEMWIDTENFFIQKFVWNIQDLRYSDIGTADTNFTVTFRNVNSAPAIQPPENAQLFSPAVLLNVE